jgi:hypothetical protein
MKKSAILVPVIALLALCAAAVAQEASPSPSATPAPTATATPAATETPAAPSPSPSPAEAKAPEEKPAEEKAEATPTPEASPSDADLLPLPVESADVPPPPDDTLPAADEPGTADVLNPDATLIPPDVTSDESVPPPPPAIVENKYKEERELKVRYQEVKLQALKDAKVRSLHEQAEAARTDEGKRQALREYYRLLFAKMVSIDKDLEKKCEEMQRAYLRRLGQYRVAPTIPLSPPPTPEPIEVVEASPTPTPKPRRGN